MIVKAKVQSKLNLENRTILQDVIPLETPYLLYLDPSSVCNFKCQFCPTGHKDLVTAADYRRSTMSFKLFEKLISDLDEFDRPIKVLRLNKIGEPFMNKHLPKMVEIAKQSGKVEYIDLATNGSLMTRDSVAKLITAGLDRLNISLEGVNEKQYLEHAKVKIDFSELVAIIRWIYTNKENCEVTIKVPGNYLTEVEKENFLNIFGDFCDRIFIEDIAPIWPSFDVETRAKTTVSNVKGQYKQPLKEKKICTYIFYGMVVNADGTVSACCPDWEQKLIIGDSRSESLKSIWNSTAMKALQIQHLEGKRLENCVCVNCGHIKYSQVDDIDPYSEAILEKIRS